MFHRQLYRPLLSLCVCLLLCPLSTRVQAESNASVNVSDEWFRSVAAAQLMYQSHSRLPVDIDTKWRPACQVASADGHCADHKVQVRGKISFDPIKKSGEPLIKVDMTNAPPMFEARWSDSGKIDVSLTKSSLATGEFSVAHTLTPEFSIFLDTPFYKGELSLDASKLVTILPGGKFNYEASNSREFGGWGWEAIHLGVSGKNLNEARLFSVTFEDLANLLGASFFGYLEGSFSVHATSRSDFVYQTKKVSIAGVPGIIDDAQEKITLPSPSQNSLDFVAQADGALSYAGEMEVLPVLHITQIAGFKMKIDLPISVGYKLQYQSGELPINFAAANVHVPLPNLVVTAATNADQAIELGQVKLSQHKETKVTLRNSGELPALIMSVVSSNPQFKVAGTMAQLEPDSTAAIKIIFSPEQEGPQQAQLTIRSNDPDQPVQVIKVSGVGEAIAQSEKSRTTRDDWALADGDAPSSDNNTELSSDGGCQMLGATSSRGNWGGFFFLALMVLTRLSRRSSS